MNKNFRSVAKSKWRRNRGSLLIDVVVGMFILMMATLSLMSLIPIVKQSEHMSSDESKCVQMTTRLIEHIQMLGADDVTPKVLESLNLIDAGQSGSPYSFTHVPLDEASMYSPAQVLDDADCELTITTLADGSKRVDILFAYRSKSGDRRTMKTGTVIGAFRG